jgi:hypothetical protein
MRTIILDNAEYGELLIDGKERDDLLNLIFASIKSDHYIDPLPIMKHLEVYYPNRLKHKLESLNVEDE